MNQFKRVSSSDIPTAKWDASFRYDDTWQRIWQSKIWYYYMEVHQQTGGGSAGYAADRGPYQCTHSTVTIAQGPGDTATAIEWYIEQHMPSSMTMSPAATDPHHPAHMTAVDTPSGMGTTGASDLGYTYHFTDHLGSSIYRMGMFWDVDSVGNLSVCSESDGWRIRYEPFGAFEPGYPPYPSSFPRPVSPSVGAAGHESVDGAGRSSYDYWFGFADRTFFTGKQRDLATGFDYFGARYYDATLSRWLSPDQPFADSHITSPQSWNLYSYSGNDPVNYLDRTGRYRGFVHETATGFLLAKASTVNPKLAKVNIGQVANFSGAGKGGADSNAYGAGFRPWNWFQPSHMQLHFPTAGQLAQSPASIAGYIQHTQLQKLGHEIHRMEDGLGAHQGMGEVYIVSCLPHVANEMFQSPDDVIGDAKFRNMVNSVYAALVGDPNAMLSEEDYTALLDQLMEEAQYQTKGQYVFYYPDGSAYLVDPSDSEEKEETSFDPNHWSGFSFGDRSVLWDVRE